AVKDTTVDDQYPDEHCSSLTLYQIRREKSGVECNQADGGHVGRAENRALMRVLKLPVVRMHRVPISSFDLVCMVDTQPEAQNHSLPIDRFPDVIVDHHPERPSSHRAAVAEVGGVYGATATILTEY